MTRINRPEELHADDVRAGPVIRMEPLPTVSRGRRAILKSPTLQNAIAFLVYLAVWVLTVAQPLAFHPSLAGLDQGNMDPNFFVWCLRWWPYALMHGLNPLYTSQLAAPVGSSLAWATTVPPLGLVAAPLTLTAGPVVSFNLLTALAPPLSAWAAFVLCRRLTGKFWPALVGGAVFGFSAYETRASAAGQLDLAYSLLLPILAYLVVAWWQRSITPRTYVILAAAAITAQFYLFTEIFADLTAILAVSLVVGSALAGPAYRPQVVRLARLTAVAWATALLLAAPYLVNVLTTKPPKPVMFTAMDLASVVMPRAGSVSGIAWLAHAAAKVIPVSTAGYIGVPLLVLAILLALVNWQSRLVRFLTCMLIFITVASLGPVLYLDGRPVATLPWGGLFDLPVVRNAWMSRLMVFAFLALAVATAQWLAGSARLQRLTRWPLAVLVIAAVALNAFPALPSASSTVPAFISSGQYRSELSPGEIVVVVSNVSNAGMLWQAQSGFYMRMAGGYVNMGYDRPADLRLADLPLPVQDLLHATPASVESFEAYVRSNKVGAILLDARQEPPRWAGIFARVGLAGHLVGNVIVYPTYDCRTCRVLGG
jgi:hypothetical protein